MWLNAAEACSVFQSRRSHSKGDRIRSAMSAIGTKRTYACAVHMSAFGGEADMPLRHGNLSGAAFRAPNPGLSTIFFV